MYNPVPARSKKTSISRSRNGCNECRRQKSKCDELKPSCSTCVRLERCCQYLQKPFIFRNCVLLKDDQLSVIEQQPRHDTSTVQSPLPSKYANSSIVPYEDQQGFVNHIPFPKVVKPQLRTGSSAFNTCRFGVSKRSGSITEGRASRQPLLPNGNEEDSSKVAQPQMNLELYKSASRLQSEKEGFYLTHWEKYCLPGLSHVFEALSARTQLSPVLNDAVLALAACNLSRTNPEVYTSKIFHDRDFPFRPRISHYMNSRMYYNSSIRNIARLRSLQISEDPISILAAILLFCYMETSICNLREYFCHNNGISALLVSSMEKIRFSPIGIEILAAREQSKYYHWWIVMHFAPFDFQSNQKALQFLLPDQCLKVSRVARRAKLLSILCESYRLSSKNFLRWWNYQTSKPESCHSMASSIPSVDDKFLLLEQRQKLFEWESEVSASELPINKMGASTRSDLETLNESLSFSSHEASLNYAYCAAAHAMQSSWRSSGLDLSKAITDDNFENEKWMTILLATVNGINKADCVHQNIYVIGVSGLLLASLLHSTSLAAGLFIENWLEELRQMQVFEEGSLPISQTLAIVQMINQQRLAGYDIFAITPMADDNGAAGKFDSYSNQTLSNVMVFGRHSRTGNPFSRCISIDDHTKA